MNTDNGHKISRRQFLQQASCAAVGSTGLFNTILNLQMANQVAAQSSFTDYKALVCIFLAGGNDSYNMLVPTNDDDYAQYQTVRGSMALPRSGADSLIKLAVQEADGREYSLHPAMPEMASLFDEGNAAFVANVGTLVEPTTVAQYKNKLVRLPRSLFSHNDQIMQWQSSVPQRPSSTGWAGRMTDVLLDSSTIDSPISMNLSFSGNNLWQTGNQSTFYTVTANGSIALTGKNDPENWGSHKRYKIIAGEGEDDVNSLIGQTYQNLFEQAYLHEYKRSVTNDIIFSEAFATGATQVNDAHFQENALSQNLKGVAKTIASRNLLGMQRQCFFITVGGWDHHNELLATQHELLRMVSVALDGFWKALQPLGVQNNVITFTASDFGRTLRSNGRGTDHAWGGHHMVMGGAPLKGGRIYGQYPSAGEMGLNEGLDVGRNGRMLPTTSVDEYMAEFALWFGVAPADLPIVFPNIGNFFTPGVDDMPLGMLLSFDERVFLPMVIK